MEPQPLPKIEPDTDGHPLEKFELGTMPKDSSAQKIAAIMLWFALPLFLLTLADRLWTWTKWLKKEKKGPVKRGKNTNETQKKQAHQKNLRNKILQYINKGKRK